MRSPTRGNGVAPQRPAHRPHRYLSDQTRATEGKIAVAAINEGGVHLGPSQVHLLSAPRRLVSLAGWALCRRDLVEWNYGEFEGSTSREISEKAPGWVLFNDGCPGGETSDQVLTVRRRIIAKARGAQGNVALFSHEHLRRVLAARWLGFPSRSGRHFRPDTGTLNTLSYYHGIPVIKRWNCAVE
jgi:broad specificity phosphatase PhoE